MKMNGFSGNIIREGEDDDDVKSKQCSSFIALSLVYMSVCQLCCIFMLPLHAYLFTYWVSAIMMIILYDGIESIFSHLFSVTILHMQYAICTAKRIKDFPLVTIYHCCALKKKKNDSFINIIV